MKNKKIIFLMGLSLSLLLVGGLSNIESHHIKVARANFDSYQRTALSGVDPISNVELDTANIFYDDFTNGLDYSNWAISEKKWGGEHSHQSGVRHENVFYNDQEDIMSLRALGEYYTKAEFVNDNEGAETTDGTYTGGVLVSREEYGPGRYEVKMRLAPIPGICSAFWIYGMKGTTSDLENQKYTEIDIEFPSRYYDSTNDKNGYRYNKMICSTYTKDNGLDENPYKTSDHASLDKYLNDNEFHEFAFEWYHTNDFAVVRWYVDGVFVESLGLNVPSYSARIWVGCWVPNNTYFCGQAKFDTAYMDVDWVKYTPFKNQTYEVLDNPLTGIYDATSPETINETRRNLLPNGDFEINSLAGYSLNDESNAIIGSDYKYSGINGLRLTKAVGSYAQAKTSILVEGMKEILFRGEVKRYGSIRANIYNISGTLLNSEEALVYNNTSPSSFITFKKSYALPSDAYIAEIVLYTESSTGLYVDNLYLGYNSAKTNNGDSYGVSSKICTENAKWIGDDSISHSVNLTNEAGKTWNIQKGNPKYAYQEDMNTVLLQPSTSIDQATDNALYLAIKEAMVSNDLFNYDEESSQNFATAAIIQEFDLTYFEDIEFSFKNLSGEQTWKKMSILYSINSGSSWDLLVSKNSNSFTSTGHGAFNYIFKASASDLDIDVSYNTIRFAFVGTAWNDSYRLTSIVINNANDFMYNLDNDDTCNATQDYIEFIEHQYASLSVDELSVLSNRLMDTIYNETYTQGYAYLRSYWGINSNSSNFIDTNIDNKAITIIVSLSCSSLLVLGMLLIIKKRKLN